MSEFEANFEFNRNNIELDCELKNTILQADLVVNAQISDKHYTHSQAAAADVWVINHNLNKEPSITITDSAGTIITGFVAEYNDLNTVTITFNGGFSGKAVLN